jgi:hypothetical protein
MPIGDGITLILKIYALAVSKDRVRELYDNTVIGDEGVVEIYPGALRFEFQDPADNGGWLGWRESGRTLRGQAAAASQHRD